MGQLGNWDDWVDTLEIGDSGKELTLDRAVQLVSAGGYGGWYIAPLETTWTIGRMGRMQRYHIYSDGRPITFDSIDAAAKCLKHLLSCTGSGVTQLQLRFQ
jgi:hypothetical protein